MIKTIKTMAKQEKERYNVPRKVQDVIPVRRIWPDGIFLVGTKFTKTYKFTDINYLVASREDKESMFLTYSELLNSLDSGAVTKITVNNRRMNKANFEQSILMPMQGDFRDEYRREYNQMLLDKATGANGITQEKYITISVVKKDIEEARAYFARVGADLVSHFAALGSKCVELDATERLRILHDFYRQGEEAEFRFNAREMMKRGHDFRDYICPDGIEKNSDYLKLGEKYCRVLFLKDYASYIKDNILKLASFLSLRPVHLRGCRGSRSADCGRTTAMSRALATLSFSIGMMAARMVLPIMLALWRRWRMDASTPSKATPAIVAVKTVTRLVTMKSMGMELRHINSHKKDPAETGWVHKGIIKFIIAQWLIAFSL